MSKCTHCGNAVDSVEDWGQSKLCEKCVKQYKDKFPERQKAKRSEIKIAKPRKKARGCYSPESGETEFTMLVEYPVIVTLNHEFMHFILHKLIGLRCCYQFDNIEHIVDRYYK